MVHIYNGILLSHNKDLISFRSFVDLWMDLGYAIQNKVRKRKVNILYLCIYVKSRKMV